MIKLGKVRKWITQTISTQQTCLKLKYTPSNRDDSEIWFGQLEAQFGLGGITVDGTKYVHLFAAFDPIAIKCVRDIVRDFVP